MNFDNYIESCNHCHNWDTEHSSTWRRSLNFFGITPSLGPSNQWPVFYHYNFAFSRISYKRNQTARGVCIWLLSLGIIDLRRGCVPVCPRGQFLSTVEWFCIARRCHVRLSIQQLMGIHVVSSFRWWRRKLLQASHTGLCVDVCSHFSRVNTQELVCWVAGWVYDL